MVLLREDPAGGGGSRKDDDPVTEEEIKKAKDIIDEFKKYWPLLLLPAFKYAYDKRDKDAPLSEAVDSVAIANFLTGYQDYIMAFAWVIASRFFVSIKNLSLTLVGAETIPTIDLNLPRGVMLGSWLVVGDYAVDFVANTREDVAELIETGKTQEDTGPLDILIATIIQVTGLGK
jgi:hypothetical protein|tara:strand:- start:1269 stop:1793 length:525 start_codon:yes stop_codon:yes gene_type:complete